MILIAASLCGPAWMLVGGPGRASARGLLAQEPLAPDEPIFRRFSTPPRRSEGRLRLIEVPVALRPQTDPNADVTRNLGFGYTVGFQPFNRIFSTAGFHWARMNWRPSDPAIDSAAVNQIDLTQSLNFWAGRTVFFSIGLGIGLADSMVLNVDGTFHHNVFPYFPLRAGATVSIADTVFVGLNAVATPFFGTGPVTGQSRLTVAVGWSY